MVSWALAISLYRPEPLTAPLIVLPTLLPPEERPRVLVVDDEKFIRDILADFLGMEGYMVRTAEDGTSAVRELEKAKYDLVITDLKMPKMGGLDLLKEIASSYPDTLTIIMTGFGTVETAIDAMKRGAYDYVLKPFKVEEILRIAERGLEKQRLAAENLRLREALSLYKVSEAIASSLSLDEVVATLEANALEELRADLVLTWLDDGKGGFFERSVKCTSDYPSDEVLGQIDSQEVLRRLTESELILAQGPRAMALFELQPRRGAHSLVVVPLKMHQRLLGFVAAISVTPSKRFEEGQRKLLSITASRAAAAIANARLYEDLQATFQQTIQSLANTIDKMDRYTAGHSQRVARYAVQLAQWIGLLAVEVETVRQAALMHDIGKIGCVMNLNKPGKLTQDEYEVFKKHPGHGREILDPIRFLEPVIPGVHLHHERWDGRGYPLGLAGKNIPLIARIISVADTYDAMTSDRAYRRALPHEVTINEIERCSTLQFDPDLVGVFTENIEHLREHLKETGVEIPE